MPITFYKWSSKHCSRIWGIFLLKWIFKISSNFYSTRGHIQDCIYYKLRGFYMEDDVVLSCKWTSNISKKLLLKHSKNIWTIDYVVKSAKNMAIVHIYTMCIHGIFRDDLGFYSFQRRKTSRLKENTSNNKHVATEESTTDSNFQWDGIVL